MKNGLFIDTWGWITLLNKREPRHKEIRSFYSDFRNKETSIYTTDYVLDETFTLLFRRLPFPIAAKAMSFIKDAIHDGYLLIEWITPERFKQAESLRLSLKGNKPFYARVVYKDVNGKFTQLLPNPHRRDNYFNGGTIYELPSGEDGFELEVSPPFGNEGLTVYASTSQLGEIEIEPNSGMYGIKTRAAQIGSKTRGVILKEKETDKEQKVPAEFSEVDAVIKTVR
ncbi:MAG: DUF4384 domain-containing protein [Nitrospirae bacterium]|nr:DUF4384 domain-containing protein [Nitrospirota bacterium]